MTSFRHAMSTVLQSAWWNGLLTALVLLNAFTIGFQTYPEQMQALDQRLGISLHDGFAAFDWIVIVIFTVDVGLRFSEYGRNYFRNGWNVFDFVIVSLSLVGQSPMFVVLRILRVVRLFRIFQQFESLRVISTVILKAITGCASISLLMLMALFIFGLAANAMFGATHPELFGALHSSMYTLFRVANCFATDEVAAALLPTYPHVYWFLLPYLFTMTFVMLSFFGSLVIFYLDQFSFADFRDGTDPYAVAAQQQPVRGPLLNPAQHAAVLAELSHLRQTLETLKSR